jgi:AraC-like protein
MVQPRRGDGSAETSITGVREQAVFFYMPELGDALVVDARYRQQRFAPHCHDTYAIGLIRSGALSFRCERRAWTAPAGAICLVNPGEVHTGEPAAEDGWAYAMAYIPVAAVRDAAAQLGLASDLSPCFAKSVIEDEAARVALASFFAAVRHEPELVARGALLVEALATIMKRTLGGRRGAEPRPEPRIVGEARAYMAERFADWSALRYGSREPKKDGSHVEEETQA